MIPKIGVKEWMRNKLIENDMNFKEVKKLYSTDFKTDIPESTTSEKNYYKELNKVYNQLIRTDQEIPSTKMIKENDVQVTEANNEKIINSFSKRIKTLDDLIKECKIDLNEWIIESNTVNKWDMVSKTEGVVQLFQIKCRLLKKNPDNQIVPTISPISININLNTKSLVKEVNCLKDCLIIPDSQNGYANINGHLEPFHDRRCWDLVLRLNKLVKPSKIILLGDQLDLAEWSDKFLKSKEFYFTTQPSLIELGWLLGTLRKDNHSAEIVYLAGNHEERLSKAFINNMVYSYGLQRYNENSMYPITSIPYMLNLEKINIKYMGPYPRNSEYWINHNLLAEHGSVVKSESGDTVKAILNKTRCSKIIGHIHRFEMASKTVYARKGFITYTVFSPGTIARIDGTVPSYSGKENWQQGIALVNYEDDNGLFKINPIPIIDGKMIYKNNVYTGNDDYVEDLMKDTGYKF